MTIPEFQLFIRQHAIAPRKICVFTIVTHVHDATIGLPNRYVYKIYAIQKPIISNNNAFLEIQVYDYTSLNGLVIATHPTHPTHTTYSPDTHRQFNRHTPPIHPTHHLLIRHTSYSSDTHHLLTRPELNTPTII